MEPIRAQVADDYSCTQRRGAQRNPSIARHMCSSTYPQRENLHHVHHCDRSGNDIGGNRVMPPVRSRLEFSQFGFTGVSQMIS